MTTDEYRELIAFLGTKFGEVDAQFRAVGARFARVEAEMHELRDEVDRRFDDSDQKMAAGFAEVKDLIRMGRTRRRT